MIKAFVFKKIGFSHIPLLFPFWGVVEKTGYLFNKSMINKLKPSIQIVETEKQCDVILIPHDYFYIRKNKEYLNKINQFSKKTQKLVVVFYHSDLDDEVLIKNSIVFRTSQYKSKIRSNEIIMPPYAATVEFAKPRPYTTKPTIGFCGWADTDFLHTVSLEAHALIDILTMKKAAQIRGLWWRKKCISVLTKSSETECSIIRRKSYSGHQATITINTEIARKEYLDNMLYSDFVLCVKGDGNYSTRYFESLSMGRIPLLLNTDICLPLDEIIPYEQVTCFVPLNDWVNIGKYASNYMSNTSKEEWAQKQNKASWYYNNYLSTPSFLNYYFTKENIRPKMHEIVSHYDK